MPLVAVPTRLMFPAAGRAMVPSSAVNLSSAPMPDSRLIPPGWLVIDIVWPTDVSLAGTGGSPSDPISSSPSINARVQEIALVVPLPTAMPFTVCVPNFALRDEGLITKLVVIDPAIAWASVARLEMPSTNVVAVFAVMVTVFPAPEVTMPLPPKISRILPIGIAEVAPSQSNCVGICG